jgi:hypothetical protein
MGEGEGEGEGEGVAEVNLGRVEPLESETASPKAKMNLLAVTTLESKTKLLLLTVLSEMAIVILAVISRANASRINLARIKLKL